MPEPIQCSPPALPPLATDDNAEPAPPRPSVSSVIATPSMSELALGCIGKINGVIIPFVAVSPNPVVAMLVGLKAGSELRECVDQRIAEASLRAGIQECLRNGGTPTGVVENVVTCQVTP